MRVLARGSVFLNELSGAMNARFAAISTALAAAALFGAATPVAKALLGSMSAFMVAGLFYLGSGIGLGVGILLRNMRASNAGEVSQKISRSEMPWLLGAIVAGALPDPRC